jgi:hypothetical protein
MFKWWPLLQIHVQVHELENWLAKVEAELKSLKYAKTNEEVAKKDTTTNVVAWWNKDDQECCKDAMKK